MSYSTFGALVALPETTPGTPSDMDAAAAQRTQEASNNRDTASMLVNAQTGLRPGWQSQTAGAYAESTNLVAAEYVAMADQKDVDARALSVYATAVRTAQDTQRSIRQSLIELRARRQQSQRELDGMWLMPADPQDAARFESRKQTLLTQQRTADEAEATLLAQHQVQSVLRVTADVVCAVTLSSADARGAWTSSAAAIQPASYPTMTMTEHALYITENHESMTPDQVAEWWASLPLEVQTALVFAYPTLFGQLGGLPPNVRVQANRLNAENDLERLKEKQERAEAGEFEQHVSPLGGTVYSAPVTLSSEEEAAIRYLEKAVSGEIQLYLWDYDGQRVIEMNGDPRTAQSVLSVMPGTNTSMSSFYDTKTGVTSLANWEVGQALTPGSVVSFTLMTGPFPQIGFPDLLTDGPWFNRFAYDRGAEYAAVLGEFDTTMGLPIISAEHSAGTGIAGVAETMGAPMAARVSLAGIGMTSEYVPNPQVEKYHIQAPNDVNRMADGIEGGSLGFRVLPSPDAGFEVLPSGLVGLTKEQELELLSDYDAKWTFTNNPDEVGEFRTVQQDAYIRASPWGGGSYVPEVNLVITDATPPGSLDVHNLIFRGDDKVNPEVTAFLQDWLERQASGAGNEN